MSARRAVAALLALAAAGPASAYVRSTTFFDQNANPKTDPTKGICLAWNTKQVAYQINDVGMRDVTTTAAACGPGMASVARAAFPAWAQSCTDFRFVDALGGAVTTLQAIGFDRVNLVVVRRGECSDPNVVPTNDPCRTSAGGCAAAKNCWEYGNDGTIALTTTTFDTTTGEIVDADMELFGWNGVDKLGLLASHTPAKGWYFTCGNPPQSLCTTYGDPSCLYMDLQATVTHEAGHMLGLDHPCQFDRANGGTTSLPSSTCVANAVMAPFAKQGDTSKRVLTADDVSGVCAIYPTGSIDRTTGCFGTGSQGTNGNGNTSGGGGGGCATAGAGEIGLLLVAALGLRRRRY